VYLSEAGNDELAGVRAAQARALADDYGFELPDDPTDFDAMEEDLDEIALQGDLDDDDPLAFLNNF